MRTSLILSLATLLLTSCVIVRTNSINQVENAEQTADNPGVTVFLLEREIPQEIKKLGVVTLTIRTNTATMPNVDQRVKDQLGKACKELGANGAYRINHGGAFQSCATAFFSYLGEVLFSDFNHDTSRISCPSYCSL